MELKVLGSSSAGNCYLLENENECLIIEAGVKFSEVKKALGFKTAKISGLILTHEHGDHARHVLEYAESGINCYASNGTLRALKSSSHRYYAVEKFKRTQIGNFSIIPFDVKHDVAEPFGFLIFHKDMGCAMFLTDTHYCEYTFKGINHFIIEANYSEQILSERVFKGEVKAFLQNRIIQSHMSLETCIETIKANDLQSAKNVVLIHLSDGNSNEAMFKKAVEQSCGVPTQVADVGSKINLSLNIF